MWGSKSYWVCKIGDILLARAGDVDICVPRHYFVSFFSSPYASHLLGRAVDISTSPEFGAEFYSPVAGRVVKIVKVFTGLGPYSKFDYVIFLRVGSYYVKLMHVRPKVSVGDLISLGDVIGNYIRSNYFSYHHLPHAHLEVLKYVTLRPTKSMAVKIGDDVLRTFRDASELGISLGELEVLKVFKDFSLCKSSTHPIALAGGMPVIPQGELGIGAGYLGLIHINLKPPKHCEVKLLGSSIGYTVRIREWYSLLSCERASLFSDWFFKMTSISNVLANSGWGGVEVYVNESRVKGLEFLLSDVCNVKIVGDLNLRPGCRVRLKITSKRSSRCETAPT